MKGIKALVPNSSDIAVALDSNQSLVDNYVKVRKPECTVCLQHVQLVALLASRHIPLCLHAFCLLRKGTQNAAALLRMPLDSPDQQSPLTANYCCHLMRPTICTIPAGQRLSGVPSTLKAQAPV